MEKLSLKKFETIVLKKDDLVKIQGGYGTPTGYWIPDGKGSCCWYCNDIC
jgi:hypothetical protein